MAGVACPWCTTTVSVSGGRYAGHKYVTVTGTQEVCPGSMQFVSAATSGSSSS